MMETEKTPMLYEAAPDISQGQFIYSSKLFGSAIAFTGKTEVIHRLFMGYSYRIGILWTVAGPVNTGHWSGIAA